VKNKIADLEEELKIAMCNSDIAKLDELLARDLIFTNHLGQVVSKEQDIDAHRNKVFMIKSINLSNQEILILGDSAVVSTQADISGSYNGQPSNEKFRFTRVWANKSGAWKVVAGHSCVIA